MNFAYRQKCFRCSIPRSGEAHAVQLDEVNRSFEVDCSDVGGIIGFGGEHLRQVRIMSGCGISLNNSVSGHPKRHILIRGSELQCEHAERLLRLKTKSLVQTTPFGHADHHAMLRRIGRG